MGKHLDIGYFKKKIKVRSKVAKKRTVINKYNAWQLEKKYYDGNRSNIQEVLLAIVLGSITSTFIIYGFNS